MPDTSPIKPESKERVEFLVGAFLPKHLPACTEAAIKTGVTLTMRLATRDDTLRLNNLYDPKSVTKGKGGNYRRAKGEETDEPTPEGAWIVEAFGSNTQLGEYRYYADSYIKSIDRQAEPAQE